mgnify:CR=1 FL=1
MKLTASDIHVELGGNEILKGIDAAIKEKECRNHRTKRKWKKYIAEMYLPCTEARYRCDHVGWKTAERI